MTTTALHVTVPTALDIRQLCEQEAPCLSIYLPAMPEVNGVRTNLVRWKNDLDEAARLLASRGVHATDIDQLLGPLRALPLESILKPSPGTIAVFRSPRTMEIFYLPRPVRPAVMAEGRFWVLPLLQFVLTPQEFYVLRLSRKSTNLLHGTPSSFVEVPLPGGVPASLDDFLQFDKPDHRLEDHVAAGASSGSSRWVRFGTGSLDEDREGHFRDYANALQRGLHDLLHGKAVPLVLAGVEPEVAAYRAVNTSPYLVPESLPGSAGERNDLDLTRRARALISDWESPDERRARTQFLEAGPQRGIRALSGVVREACHGNVAHLFVCRDEIRPGDFDKLSERMVPAGGFISHHDDLVNAAAVETVLHSGHVWILPPERMPADRPALAFLRH